MKKIALCTILLLCFFLSTAYGELWDEAGIFSEAEAYIMNSNIRAQEYKIGHGVKIAVLTVNTTGASSIERAAKKACDERMPEAENGILFLLAVKDREFYTCTFGDYVDANLSSYKLDSVYDDMMSDLSKGYYDSALKTFVSKIPDAFNIPRVTTSYQNTYNNTSPYQTTYEESTQDNNEYTIFVLLGAVVVALIVVACMSSSMKKIRPQKNAGNYAHNFHLTRSEDIYLYTTTTRHRIQTQSSNHSHHSSGRSYHGSGRHF